MEMDLYYYRTLTDSCHQQLPRTTQRCPYCHENDAVYFQSQQRAADTGMVSGLAQKQLKIELTCSTETFLRVYIM